MIYHELFNDEARLEVSFPTPSEPLVTFVGTGRNLLRTCKTIDREARRLLEDHTTLHISAGLIRDSYRSVIPYSTSTAIESFARNMKLNGHLWFCHFPQLDLSAFQQLRRLEFKIHAYGCCVRKNLHISGDGDGPSTANVLQHNWLDNAARGWGLARRIERVEVKVDQIDKTVYDFCITLNPPRSALRRTGRVLVSYAEGED